MKLYHGTQVQNIEQLKPFATRGNAISKPVICFTPNYGIALLYIWNRSYKWITFSENENGKVVFTEHYENMLYDFYNKVSGSIYECDGDNPSIIPTHMKGVYTSEVPVPVEKEKPVEKYGWIAPDGRFFGCSYGGHSNLARKIVGDMEYVFNPERHLEDKGWVKILTGTERRGKYTIGMGVNKKLTDNQIKTLQRMELDNSYGISYYL